MNFEEEELLEPRKEDEKRSSVSPVRYGRKQQAPLRQRRSPAQASV